MQQLRNLLGVDGQEMLDSLPDGIHSGLVKPRARGVFFYFQAPAPDGQKLNFWKYYGLNENKIYDNRYTIANLIACDRDTPRVVEPEIFGSVFGLQEKVIEDILQSVQEQRALEMAPRSTDPIQQTVATLLQGYLNHPEVNRRQAVEVIRFLNHPMFTVQIRNLRQAYKNFQKENDIKSLLVAIEGLKNSFGDDAANGGPGRATQVSLKREDLRLICFDVIS